MTRTQWRRFQRKQKLTAKEAEAGGKAVATQKAEKVEMAKRPVKERLSIIVEEPIAENAQGGAEDEDDMEDDDLLDEGSDFDVMVNVVSILPLEYDVPTEVNELEEDFEALNLADHKPMCYYVMQNDLHSHNVVLANYEGKTGHSLGAVQLEVCVGSTVRKTLFMVIAAKPNYNLLLGREWIHGVGAIPSTMHQRLIIWREDGLVENVEADQSAYVSETGTVTLQNFDKNLASIAPCAENRIKMALEAIKVQENMAVEANDDLRNELVLEASEVNDGKKQRLDCIYDDEPLGFEKDPHSSIQRMQAQDPLQEVDIGDGSVKRPTYISANIDPTLREKMVELLKKYRDCFAWDYNEMPGLSRNLVEHRLPLRPDKKPVKQLPRRFAPEIMTKIKAEIERLLKCKFIRTTRYVEWLANIVPVMKKNGSLRVCIDFRDLNNATPKDEYSMPVAEMLVDSAAGHEYLIFVIDNLADTDWRQPIVKYIENPTGTADRKVKYRALNYTIMGNELFKKTPEGVLLKCLNENEAYVAVSNAHSGACGAHQAGHKMKWLLFRQDQGTVFVGRKMQDFAEQLGFKLMTSTPYYAQANGQVEAANKVIISLIKKHVAQKPKNWHKTLDQVLWACRNSPKESTGSTPFRLTYGHDAVLPVEIMMQSIRVQRQWELPPDHYENIMLDELTDVDEERLQALDALIRQKERIARAYNKRVKSKLFDVGDLVWKVILPMDRRDRVFGKWSPNWEGPFKISQVLSNGAYEIEELTPERRSVNMNGKYLKKYKPMLFATVEENPSEKKVDDWVISRTVKTRSLLEARIQERIAEDEEEDEQLTEQKLEKNAIKEESGYL
ncbi:unnamed protein product [Trifolium pratense]|uniref:Uncharacterized protein n=1 Tax=Trifolium pratense TaxID=57577 RepID=A0ACB0IDU2_TRIPR|nr:unnamed protein product [Trifolium pratense]